MGVNPKFQNLNKLDLELRRLTSADLPFCRKLVSQAGWNQVDADWLRVMELDPSGCFVTNADGQKVGTIVYTRFPSNPQKSIPSVAWISMVLVDRDFRNRGIGREMFSKIVSHLRASNTDTIRLDATDMGLNLYKKFGFREEYELIRFTRQNAKADIPDAAPRGSDLNLAGIASLDATVTHTDRRQLLEVLMKSHRGQILEFRSEERNKIVGYVGFRPGRLGWQIGPCVAEVSDAGLEALKQALDLLSAKRLIIDIPIENLAGIRWAEENRFREQRRFTRMYLGNKPTDRPDLIFASFGPEKG